MDPRRRKRFFSSRALLTHAGRRGSRWRRGAGADVSLGAFFLGDSSGFPASGGCFLDPSGWHWVNYIILLRCTAVQPFRHVPSSSSSSSSFWAIWFFCFCRVLLEPSGFCVRKADGCFLDIRVFLPWLRPLRGKA